MGPTTKGRGGEGEEEVRWGGDGSGEEGRGAGEKEGGGRPPNVRDALTPLPKERRYR